MDVLSHRNPMKMDVRCCILEARVQADADQVGAALQ